MKHLSRKYRKTGGGGQPQGSLYILEVGQRTLIPIQSQSLYWNHEICTNKKSSYLLFYRYLFDLGEPVGNQNTV